MLRIKDPQATIPFYENNFGLKLVHKYVNNIIIFEYKIIGVFFKV